MPSNISRMLQYLLNVSAIWFLGLFAFDLLLKDDTYHRYNRAYLLSLLFAGLVIPMLSWQGNPVIYHTPVLAQPVEQAARVKNMLAVSVAQVKPKISTELVLLFIYLLGIFIALVFIAKEIYTLLRLYRSAAKTREQNWMIVETGKEHGVFSVMHYLFVTDKTAYTAHEWTMLLQHEAAHARQGHMLDLVVLQIIKAFMWFNPLVYVFEKRLLLVHEYLADSAGKDKPATYGHFLIEQSMAATPFIVHSFNRSPIKKRIDMLTKTSPRRNSIKLLVALPLAVCSLLCFTKTGFSFDPDDKNTIIFRGNKFEFGFGDKNTSTMPAVKDGKANGKEMIISSNSKADGITLDGAPGGGEVKIMAFSAPMKMNGQQIYCKHEGSTEPEFTGKDGSLTTYLFNGMKEELALLNDGDYNIHISYPIISEAGKIVYYENQGITKRNEKQHIDNAVKKTIDDRIVELLDNAPKYKPAMVAGKPVPYYEPWAFEMGYYISVHNHNVTLAHSEPTMMR